MPKTKEILETISACRICDNPTPVRFNVSFAMVPICEQCARAIFKQQAEAYLSAENDFVVRHCKVLALIDSRGKQGKGVSIAEVLEIFKP